MASFLTTLDYCKKCEIAWQMEPTVSRSYMSLILGSTLTFEKRIFSHIKDNCWSSAEIWEREGMFTLLNDGQTNNGNVSTLCYHYCIVNRFPFICIRNIFYSWNYKVFMTRLVLKIKVLVHLLWWKIHAWAWLVKERNRGKSWKRRINAGKFIMDG